MFCRYIRRCHTYLVQYRYGISRSERLTTITNKVLIVEMIISKGVTNNSNASRRSSNSKKSDGRLHHHRCLAMTTRVEFPLQVSSSQENSRGEGFLNFPLAGRTYLRSLSRRGSVRATVTVRNTRLPRYHLRFGDVSRIRSWERKLTCNVRTRMLR